MRRIVDRSSRFVCKARERVAGLIRSHVSAARCSWENMEISLDNEEVNDFCDSGGDQKSQKWNLEIKRKTGRSRYPAVANIMGEKATKKHEKRIRELIN